MEIFRETDNCTVENALERKRKENPPHLHLRPHLGHRDQPARDPALALAPRIWFEPAQLHPSRPRSASARHPNPAPCSSVVRAAFGCPRARPGSTGTELMPTLPSASGSLYCSDDFVLAIIGAPAPTLEAVVLGSRGGVASRGVAGIGVGLTYSSSSADVVREKLTACAFRCGVVFSPVRKSVGTGVIGTTGSSCAPSRSGTFEVMSDYMLSRSPALLAPVE